jgi:hypothetical protein
VYKKLPLKLIEIAGKGLQIYREVIYYCSNLFQRADGT